MTHTRIVRAVIPAIAWFALACNDGSDPTDSKDGTDTDADADPVEPADPTDCVAVLLALSRPPEIVGVSFVSILPVMRSATVPLFKSQVSRREGVELTGVLRAFAMPFTTVTSVAVSWLKRLWVLKSKYPWCQTQPMAPASRARTAAERYPAAEIASHSAE